MNASERVPLSGVCRQDRSSVRPGELTHLRYLGMESIESGTGRLANGELAKTPEAPEANAFRFTPAHVLYGKLRPYLNKVFAPDFEGKCSTELVPILPNERLDRRYLAYFLRTPCTVDAISQKVAGARMPRADMSFVMSLPIPIPALQEQQRLVELLSRAENIVRMRREAERKAKEIIPALFLDMFGDPATNPRGWEIAPIEDCCTLVRGSSPRPQGDPRYFGGPVPRLMIADITRDGMYVTPRIDSLTPSGAERSRPMNCGDVVMAVSGACGLPAILAIDACIHDGFVGFRSLSKNIRGEYLYTFLSVIRQDTEKQAVGATFQNLKTDQIKAWRIPIPPVQIQNSFVERAKSLRRLGDNMACASRYSDSTFQSLLARVFSEGKAA